MKRTHPHLIHVSQLRSFCTFRFDRRCILPKSSAPFFNEDFQTRRQSAHISSHGPSQNLKLHFRIIVINLRALSSHGLSSYIASPTQPGSSSLNPSISYHCRASVSTSDTNILWKIRSGPSSPSIYLGFPFQGDVPHSCYAAWLRAHLCPRTHVLSRRTVPLPRLFRQLLRQTQGPVLDEGNGCWLRVRCLYQASRQSGRSGHWGNEGEREEKVEPCQSQEHRPDCNS